MFTFEEFFKGEGVFNQSSHWGASLGPLISNVCQLLYNEDVVMEDAFLTWANEKEGATDADDRLFYNKVGLRPCKRNVILCGRLESLLSGYERQKRRIQMKVS